MCWPVKLWRCKMTSLVNKSGDWTPNYHKILIFSPPKSLKSLCAARIDELADSYEPEKWIEGCASLEAPPRSLGSVNALVIRIRILTVGRTIWCKCRAIRLRTRHRWIVLRTHHTDTQEETNNQDTLHLTWSVEENKKMAICNKPWGFKSKLNVCNLLKITAKYS